jgi:hypothetical protein
MRWCHHCRHYNSGWPPRCRYCAAGLAGRLCTRNHVNPLDWRLTFCGECGAPLTRISGAGLSVRPYVVAGGIWLAAWALVGLLVLIGARAPEIALALMLVILALGSYLAWQVLPPAGQQALRLLGRFIRYVAHVAGMVMHWVFRFFSGRRSRTRHKRRR